MRKISKHQQVVGGTRSNIAKDFLLRDKPAE